MAKVKTSVMLQNKYFYVRCRLGFTLEGVTTYEIPTQLGFFGFLVEELKTYLGDYVTVTYDEDDTGFQCWTSEVLVTEIQSLSSVGVEEILKDTSSLVTGVNSVGAMLSGIPHFIGVYPGAKIRENTSSYTYLSSCPSFVNPSTSEGGYIVHDYNYNDNIIKVPREDQYKGYDMVHDTGFFAVFYDIPQSQHNAVDRTLLKAYDCGLNKVLVNDNFKKLGFRVLREKFTAVDTPCNVDIYFKGFSIGGYIENEKTLFCHDFSTDFTVDYYKDFEFSASLRNNQSYNLFVPFEPYRFYYFKVDMYSWSA